MSLNPVSQSSNSYGLFESNSHDSFITNSKIAATDDNPQIVVADDAKIPVKVSLKDKPAGMSAGEYLLRQALEKIAPHVGLDSSDVEAEIQARKELVSWGFTTNYDKTTNLQLKEEIATSGSETVMNVRASTVERMLKRDAVGKWLVEKKALGIPLSEEDYRLLSEAGFGLKELERFGSNPKYQKYETEFRQTMETKSFETMLHAEIAYLKDNLDQVFPEPKDGETGKNVRMANLDAQIDREAQRRVYARLTGSGLSALEYVKQEGLFQASVAELKASGERVAKMPWSTYLKETGKNLYAGIAKTPPEMLKGAAVITKTLGDLGIADPYGYGIALPGSGVMFKALIDARILPKPNKGVLEPNGTVQDSPYYRLGDYLEKNLDKNLQLDPDVEKTFFGGVAPQTVGGALTYLLGGAIVKSPKLVAMVISSTATGGRIYDEAKKVGASESDAQRAALLNMGIVAPTEAFGMGKVLGRLNEGAAGNTWRQLFREAVKDGAQNAGVEGVQAIGENVIARNTFDPNRRWTDNVLQRMTAAGITGTTASMGIQILQKVRNAKSANPTEINAKIEERQTSVNDLKTRLNQQLDQTNAKMTPDAPGSGVTGPARAGRAAPFDLIEWENSGFKYDDLPKIREELMARQDIGRVTDALRSHGVEANREVIEAVKKYNFDSAGIGLSTQNYDAWNRLATGKGQLRDVQYLRHEIREVEELRRIQQDTGFDFTGKNYEQLSAAKQKKWDNDWKEAYGSAHQKALETEYDFLAVEAERATNGQVRISRTQAAVADAESTNVIGGGSIGRTEGVDYMKIDGMDIKKHSNYANWQQKANETVSVRSSLRRELGLPINREITLAELVLALRRSKIKSE